MKKNSQNLSKKRAFDQLIELIENNITDQTFDQLMDHIQDNTIDQLIDLIQNNKTDQAIDLINQMSSEQLNKQLEFIDGNTPLIEACMADENEVVKILIEKKVDINIKNYDNENAFIKACINNNDVLTNLLYENGTDIHEKNAWDYNPLMWLCWHGNINLACKLIERKVDINATAEDGSTAFLLACSNNHKDVIKLLLEHKADVNAENTEEGQNVWQYLNVYKEDEIAKLIVKTGKFDIKKYDNINYFHKIVLNKPYELYRDENMYYYNKIKFKIDFENKCEKDRLWLEDNTIIFRGNEKIKIHKWDNLVKMLKYYITGYKVQHKDQIGSDTDSFFSNNCLEVKKILKTHITKYWYTDQLISYNFQLNNNLSVCKPVLWKIGKYLFENLCISCEEDYINKKIFDQENINILGSVNEN